MLREKLLADSVAVIAAGVEDEPVLANLLELYAHDFSEFVDLELQPNGRFGYPWLALYWMEPNRVPLIVKVNDGLAGFALVTKGSSVREHPETWDMAEFFIARGFRRRGIGEAAAHEIWRRYPGDWEVRVRENNVPALGFWRATVSSFIQSPARAEVVRVGEKRWQLFSFTT